MIRNDGLLYACVSHVPLVLPFPTWVTPVYTDLAQGPGRHNLRDLAPEWQDHHPLLGGAAATFAIKSLVERTPGVRRIGVCQYRKFVSRHALGTRAADSYKTMDLVARATLGAERLAAALEPGPEPFLVSRLMVFRRLAYLDQYARAHRAQDLLHFAAEAVEEGVMTGPEARAFLNEQVFVPGGIELGVFPADFWLPAVAQQEAVVRRCIARHPVPDEGYQRRAWAFCAERLGSWFLLRHFRGRTVMDRVARMRERIGPWVPGHWSRRWVGRLNLVDLEGRADYVPGST